MPTTSAPSPQPVQTLRVRMRSNFATRSKFCVSTNFIKFNCAGDNVGPWLGFAILNALPSVVGRIVLHRETQTMSKNMCCSTQNHLVMCDAHGLLLVPSNRTYIISWPQKHSILWQLTDCHKIGSFDSRAVRRDEKKLLSTNVIWPQRNRTRTLKSDLLILIFIRNVV